MPRGAPLRPGPRRRPRRQHAAALQPAPVDLLAGGAVGVGNVAGTLNVEHDLHSGAVGVGRATATLNIEHDLRGAATGVGVGSGSLGLVHNLSGAVVGVGAASGTLGDIHNLAATAVGIGQLQGALAVINPVPPPPPARVAAGATPPARPSREIRHIIPRHDPDVLIALLVAGEIDEEEYAALMAEPPDIVVVRYDG